MSFCTYIWSDPKNGIPIYIGMGKLSRPNSHITQSHNHRLGATLRKRLAEGYELTPRVLVAESMDDASEMEMLLISMIGRADIGTGTLFNLTDGGDRGPVGHRVSEETRAKLSLAQLRYFSNPEARERKSRAMKLRAELGINKGGRKPLKCTVDGVTVYQSRKELIAALGQGKLGLKHSNFRWIQ